MLYINSILIECLVISSLLIILLCVRMFNRVWLNVCIYVLFSIVVTWLVSFFFARCLNVAYSHIVYIPTTLFCAISTFVYVPFTSKSKPRKGEDIFKLESAAGTIKFYYARDNFLVYGGAGSGKTASIGKPLLAQYIQSGWAGFIYDYKDFDYTQTAYNLIHEYDYPHEFYQVSFTDMSRTYRFNLLKKTVMEKPVQLLQAMDDFLKAMLPADGKTDEWYNGALGLLRGVALRFYKFKGEYEKYCTLPHILNFILLATSSELLTFLEGDTDSRTVGSAFVASRDSERTLASYSSSLNNYISTIAVNRNVCYVLSGDDFDFNLVDPKNPKLFAISNSWALDSLISPIIAMLVPLAARKIEFGNKVKFAFIMDEMTTFKVNNFQNMPSVLREYGVSFLIMTQSGSKIEKIYGKHDRSSIEANCANIFFGRTFDVESLKYYPLFFGKEDVEKESTSAGSSSGKSNSSVTRSKQKEEVYESKAFTMLSAGEFIMSLGDSNKKKLKTKFKIYRGEEKPLPIITLTTDREVNEAFERIICDCEKLLEELAGR